MNDSFGARLVALIAHPNILMAWIKERPTWVAPSLLMFGVMLAFTATISHIAGPEQLELMRDSRLMRMMPEETWQKQYDASLDPTPVKRIRDGVSAGLGTWASAFILAAILHGFCKLSGGNGRFKHMLGLVYWTGLIPYVLGSILRLPLVLAKESVMGVSLGLAALGGGLEYTSFGYQLLTTYGDFTMWWALVLLVIGVGKVYELNRGSAIAVVILPWALISGILFGVGRFVM